jgi:putative membrane protein
MKNGIFSLLLVCAATVAPTFAPAADVSSGSASPKAARSSNSVASASSRGMTASDLSFMNEAAPGGLTEVELGKLAVKRASNADVKKFAQRMIDEHSQANRELDELAAQKNVTLKKEKTPEQQAAIDKLSKLNGNVFDREYAKDMLKDHEKDVAKFEAAADEASDPDVKTYAEMTLPTLRGHLDMARKLQQAEARTSSR